MQGKVIKMRGTEQNLVIFILVTFTNLVFFHACNLKSYIIRQTRMNTAIIIVFNNQTRQ